MKTSQFLKMLGIAFGFPIAVFVGYIVSMHIKGKAYDALGWWRDNGLLAALVGLLLAVVLIYLTSKN